MNKHNVQFLMKKTVLILLLVFLFTPIVQAVLVQRINLATGGGPESDPCYAISPASGITDANIIAWQSTTVNFNTLADARISNAVIDALGDVDTTGVTLGKVLMYSGPGAGWVDANLTDTFTFGISAFTWNDTVSTVVEMGPVSTTWLGPGAIHFDASYTAGPPDATPYIDKTSPGWTASLLMTPSPSYIGPTQTIYTTNYPSAILGTRMFTLCAVKGGESSNVSRTVTFWNRIHYGITTKTNGYTSSDIGGLANSQLFNTTFTGTGSSKKTFTVTIGIGEYILFAAPSRLDGGIIFKVGGLEGGFQSPEIVSRTNGSGFIESFKVWRSSNDNLGVTTVECW